MVSFLRLKVMIDSFDAYKSCLAYLKQIELLPNNTDEDMSALTRAEIELGRVLKARLDRA